MNIFYLSHDPKKAASYHYNRHIVKMPLEAAQMLCTAHHALGEEHNYDTSYVPYRKAHLNHPCTIWVRSDVLHYYWTYDYMMELGKLYKERYNKTHLTIEKCRDILSTPPNEIKNSGVWIDPPQCMPDEYKSDNAIHAYWNYYINAKNHIPTKDELPHLQTPAEIQL